MAKAPSTDELRRALFAPDQPAVVRWEPGIGVVASVLDAEEGYIRLLVLDPVHRGHGLGHELLRAAESDLDAAAVITVGADSPYFLFPGVPVTETALCCLLERHHYTREETNYNIDIDLADLPPDPGLGIEPAVEERAEIDEWMARHWPNWRAEVMRAFDQGSLLLGRDSRDITGFCAYDVNRSGTLGPIASRPDLIGKARGAALLVGALHRLRQAGHATIEVLWVGPMVPYARLGGEVGQLFFVYRRRR
jgi:N-acetylglutamate synthase-like GNAT family acetyltransferase